MIGVGVPIRAPEVRFLLVGHTIAIGIALVWVGHICGHLLHIGQTVAVRIQSCRQGGPCFDVIHHAIAPDEETKYGLKFVIRLGMFYVIGQVPVDGMPLAVLDVRTQSIRDVGIIVQGIRIYWVVGQIAESILGLDSDINRE